MLKISARVERVCELLAQLFRAVPDATIQVGKIRIEVVIHFKLRRGFIEM